jgi:hypothetical protein
MPINSAYPQSIQQSFDDRIEQIGVVFYILVAGVFDVDDIWGEASSILCVTL